MSDDSEILLWATRAYFEVRGIKMERRHELNPSRKWPWPRGRFWTLERRAWRGRSWLLWGRLVQCQVDLLYVVTLKIGAINIVA